MPDNIKFVKEDEAQAYSDELNKPSRMSFQEGGAPKLPSKVATRKQAEALQDQQGGGTVVMQNPDGTFSVVPNDERYSFGYNKGGSAKSDPAALKKAIAANKAAMGMGDLLGIPTPKEIKKSTAKPRNFKGTF
jgi:hypothetical protein